MARDVILLSTGRKGTMLTLTALASRADLRVFDQVIAPDFQPGATGPEVLARVFDSADPRMAATVLPLAWFNARDCYPGFWEELQRRRVHVIHLQRRNVLRSYVSRQMALTTGAWIRNQSDPPAAATVHVDPAGCRAFVEHELQSDAAAARFFVGHERMELHYEALLSHYDDQLARVQRFLGLSPCRVRPTCLKQTRVPLSRVVRNYADLCRAWAETPWPEWLADDGIEPGIAVAGPDQRAGHLYS